jgi:hypothetical protein
MIYLLGDRWRCGWSLRSSAGPLRYIDRGHWRPRLPSALALICRVIFHVLSSVDFIFSSARFILEKGRDAQFSVPLIKPSHHFGRAIVDFSEALIANGGGS